MVCCWAGEDGRFNNYEIARAGCIYATLPIESFILWYVARYFYRTRRNFEMTVRVPRALIMSIVTLWMCTIFEAISNLVWDLDLAKLNWDKSMKREKASVSSIFAFLARAGYVACGAIYLYRIWMIWYRSELNQVAQNKGEAVAKGSQKNWSPSVYVRMGNSLRARKKVRIICITWVFSVVLPLFLVDFILVIDQKMIKPLRGAICMVGAVPIFTLMVLLARNVKNCYGLVEEYKMALAAITFTTVLRFALFFTGLAESYYRFLIDFECEVVNIVAYFIYLMYIVWTFDVQRSSLPPTEMCAKLLNCCKGHSSQDSLRKITFQDYTLQQLLSDRHGWKLFLSHAHETLCTENLFFFVDVYRHRKSFVNNDPFIRLSEGETDVVYACARINMDWIDQQLRIPSTRVLSCTEIYNLYIKSSSQLEINIPGKMRKQLEILFKRKISTRSGLSFIGRLWTERGSAAQVPLSTTMSIPKLFKWSTSALSADSMTPNLRTQRSMQRGSQLWNLPVDDIKNFSAQRMSSTQESGTECQIDDLYPAWKAVVNLLNTDSLVRFKMGDKGRTRWTEHELDQIPSIQNVF